MLIGGLWHGANWTFVAWGGLHGVYLIINHIWKRLSRATTSRFMEAASTGVTFLAVLVAWVFFRSETFAAALRVLKGLSGSNGISLPASLAWVGQNLGLLESSVISPKFAGITPEILTPLDPLYVVFWIAVSSIIVWALPNSQELVLRMQTMSLTRIKLLGVTMGLLFALSVISFSKVSEFLYFQF
jgi:hypothetical protein